MAFAVDLEKLRLVLTRELHLAGGASTLEPTDIAEMIDTAVQMVRSYVGASDLPDKIAHRAVLEVARELNTRMLSPGGVFSAFADAGSPVRLARDPLRAVYPMLAPYVRPGFA